MLSPMEKPVEKECIKPKEMKAGLLRRGQATEATELLGQGPFRCKSSARRQS